MSPGSRRTAPVGIFGGSFDPVHVGHLRLAEEIQARFAFAPLWIVPSKCPPHKPPYVAGDKERLEMVRLAFAGVAGAEVSTFELESERPSYSIHTIEHFRKRHPVSPLYFVLGADAFHEIPNWYSFPAVLESCHYVVVARAGFEADGSYTIGPRLERRLAELAVGGFLTLDEGTANSAGTLFHTREGTTLTVLKLRLPEVSSTEVRLRIQLGQDAGKLVPSEVGRYLKMTGLYGTPDKS